ncbi:MAG: hypothetical protein AAF919_17565 [Pseudomonadota bacterium]
MSDSAEDRPRGLNFLLGGTVVAACFLAYAVLGGGFEFGGTAPDVRIDRPLAANAGAQ